MGPATVQTSDTDNSQDPQKLKEYTSSEGNPTPHLLKISSNMMGTVRQSRKKYIQLC